MTQSDMSAFPEIACLHPGVRAWCVTPSHPRSLHRFFDTSPISPSGRYLAVIQLPYDERLPVPGDRASIILVDLKNGDTHTVAKTAGWDTQLGAQVQWGATDEDLYYADVDTDSWSVRTIRHNPFKNEKQVFNGPLYMLSPDGHTIAGPDLRKMGKTQLGYGVHLPEGQIKGNEGASATDGVFLTDTKTSETSLLLSIQDLVEAILSPAERQSLIQGDFYVFHVKWNNTGARLMIVLRWIGHNATRRNMLVTVQVDKGPKGFTWSEPRMAVSADIWMRGGHHPNWCPDGETILMNLKADSAELAFCTFRHDGTDFKIVAPACPGSGHPTMHPNGRHILTDCYLNEGFEDANGLVPLRWVDMVEDQEVILLKVDTHPKQVGPNHAFRIDPHPAWDKDFQRITFNAVYKGERHVFIADLSALV